MGILESLRSGGLVDIKFSLNPFISGVVYIAGVPVDFQRIIILGVAAIAVFGLLLFTHWTKIGLSLRAIAQDEQAALLLGINSDVAASAAMALSSVLLVFSAAVVLPLGDIRVDSGYDVLIFSLSICIVGGLGSWWGTILAAFIFGFAQILTSVYLSSSFTMVTVFALLLLVLIIRPSGLMGKQRELEERV
jgi:branched-chain amino acid transport system permease protein